MRRKDPESIQSVLSQWKDESPEMAERLLEAKALEYLRRRFYPLRHQIREIRLLEHVLKIGVSSASLRNQLVLTKCQLVEQINEHLNYNLIDEAVIQ